MTNAVPLLQLSLDDPNWTLLRNLGIGLVVVLWLASAYWTFKDARRRIDEPWLVGLATLVLLLAAWATTSPVCKAWSPTPPAPSSATRSR